MKPTKDEIDGYLDTETSLHCPEHGSTKIFLSDIWRTTIACGKCGYFRDLFPEGTILVVAEKDES